MGSNEVQNYCGEELQPGDNFSSDKDILQFIRDKAETLYHPSGTCKMGQDKTAVVDEKLKVRGLKNLRVADASIMPTLISGNTNGPCMMIGERCADFIMINIGKGIDYQPCGGTHVNNTSEIREVKRVKVENKGRMNKRVIVDFST